MAALKPAAPADDYTKQFDVARSRASTAANADLQAKRDALARRAAQLGGGPSGAFIKAEQGAFDETQKNLGAANEQIDAAQQAEGRRIKEIQDAQRFQSSEREATQQFAAGQSAMDRRFQQQQFEANKAAQEAALTGKFNGQDTIQARQYADQKAAQDREFTEQLKMNYANTMLNAHNSKLDPKLMLKYLEGLDVTIDENGTPVVNQARVPNFTSAAPEPKANSALPTKPPFGVRVDRVDSDGARYYSDGSYTDRYGKYHPVQGAAQQAPTKRYTSRAGGR